MSSSTIHTEHDDDTMSMASLNSLGSYDLDLDVTLQSGDTDLNTSTDEIRERHDDERVELGKLNYRLEKYITKIKAHKAVEKAWKNDYIQLHKKYKLDLETANNLYTTKLASLRKESEEYLARIGELELTLYSNKVHQDALEDKVKQEQKISEQYKTQNITLSHQLADAITKIGIIEGGSSDIEDKTKYYDDKIEKLQENVTLLRKDNQNLEQELSKVKSRARAAEQILDAVKISHDKEKEMLLKQIASLNAMIEKTTDATRRDYADTMKKVFDDRHQEALKDKQLAIDALTTEYQEKMDGYRDSLRALAHSLENERAISAGARNDLEDTLLKLDEVDKSKQALEEQIAYLNGLVEQLRAGESELLKEKNETIREIKDAFRQKDKEFEEFVGLKHEMGLEINSILSLLSAEEERMNIGAHDYEKSHTSSILDNVEISSNIFDNLKAKKRPFFYHPDLDGTDEEIVSTTIPASTSTSATGSPVKLLSETIDDEDKENQNIISTIQPHRISINKDTDTGAGAGAGADVDMEGDITEEEEKPRGILNSLMNLIRTPSKTPNKRRRKSQATTSQIVPFTPFNTPVPNTGLSLTANPGVVSTNTDASAETPVIQEGDNEEDIDTMVQEILEDMADNQASKSDAEVDGEAVAETEAETETETSDMNDQEKKDAEAEESQDIQPEVEVEAEEEAEADVEDEDEDESILDSNDAGTSSLIAGSDDTGVFVTIENGSDYEVSLAGWSLQTKVTEFIFAFPDDAVLGPKENFTIKTPHEGSNAPEDNYDVGEDGIVWLDQNVWGEDDECYFVNSANEIKARVEIVRQ